jgi:hypothetical protein
MNVLEVGLNTTKKKIKTSKDIKETNALLIDHILTSLVLRLVLSILNTSV